MTQDTHMASSKRFLVLRETIRHHPLIVASTAATAGVLLGGFVSVQLLDVSQPAAVSPPAPVAAAEVKAEKPVPETTGSAPASENTASAECERQTWPYLSGDCLDEYRRTHRTARVVSTDKLDEQTVNSIENPSITAEIAAPAPWSPAVASTAPLVPASVTPMAPTISSKAAAEPTPTTTASVTQSSETEASKSQATAKSEEKEKHAAANDEKEKHAAKKARRKPKSERRIPAKPQFDDDSDDGAVAAAYSDEGDDEPVAASRRGRAYVVERRGDRGYGMPDEGDRGGRPVIVIQRDRGETFGNLFGGF
jgi:hypothetical protein